MIIKLVITEFDKIKNQNQTKIQNSMQNNSSKDTSTPVGLTSTFPTTRWASNTFDILKFFNFPTDNQWQYTFSASNSNTRVFLNHIFLRRTRERKTSYRTQQILQLFTKVEQAFLWLKCSSQQFKVQLTHSKPFICPITKEQRLRFYGSYCVTRQVSNPSFKVGILWANPNSNDFLDMRLRFNIGQFSNEKYFYLKGASTIERVWKWNLGGIIVYDWKRRLLQKNDIKLGLQITNNSWLGLQLESEGFRNYKLNPTRFNSFFDILRTSYIYHFNANKCTAGVSVEQNIENNYEIKKIEAVMDFNPSSSIPQWTNCKVRVSNNLQVAVAGTFALLNKIKIEGGLLFNKLNFMPANFAFNITLGQQ